MNPRVRKVWAWLNERNPSSNGYILFVAAIAIIQVGSQMYLRSESEKREGVLFDHLKECREQRKGFEEAYEKQFALSQEALEALKRCVTELP